MRCWHPCIEHCMIQAAPNLSVITVAELVRLTVAPVFLLSRLDAGDWPRLCDFPVRNAARLPCRTRPLGAAAAQGGRRRLGRLSASPMPVMTVAMLTAGGLAPCLSSAVGGLIERYTEVARDV